MKKYCKKELEIGTKVEMEHTKSKTVARKIAMDHLNEFPHYYTKGLLPMENRLKEQHEMIEEHNKRARRRKKLGFGGVF